MKKLSNQSAKANKRGSKRASVRSIRRGSAPDKANEPTNVVADYVSDQRPLDSDESAILARARSSWYCGDWGVLAAVDATAVRRHPDRGKLALLVASAQQQLGEHAAARRGIELAMHWGCSPRLVAEVLIAGVYNTLGRAAALRGDKRRTRSLFSAAVAVGTRTDEIEVLGHVRSVRELARIGLLPDAAALLEQEIATTREAALRPVETKARIDMLQTELELLHHELSLAQQRQQLSIDTHGATLTFPPRPGDSAWIGALKKKAVSQLGQDLWVLERTGYKRGGFFVEFGATDGVLLSNTFLLEKEFSWSGICAEANPKLFEELKQNRSCTVACVCISGHSGEEIDFVFADAYGGFAKYANDDLHAAKRAAYSIAKRTARLKGISLHDFLKKNGAPYDIDYLSIDTEGSEFEILSTFPFEKWQIRLITVEHNFTGQRDRIRALLSAHGYQCYEREWDDWYVKEEAFEKSA